MKINKQSLQKVYEGIASSFKWSRTKQGDLYWDGVMNELISLGAIHDPKSFQFVSDTNIPLCIQAQISLQAAFTWKDSPKGESYWRKVYHNITEIISDAGGDTEELQDNQNLDKAYDEAMKIL